MIGHRIVLKRSGKDQEEKPFWISFADLMTALMVLFLVVMGVALLAVTKEVTERERRELQYNRDIAALLDRFAAAAARYQGINIDRDRRVIDFHEKAHFAFAKSTLSPDAEASLRQFSPEILAIANSDVGRRVLKRIVVEGYTDRAGSYLSNMNLSLQRSQRVLCAMFATSGEHLLSDGQKEDVRRMFLVGGYSSNAAKQSDEESRRVEMRIELLGLDEDRPSVPESDMNFGTCAL
jgi:outer membrane protein OmpA-like peptidoglycan-associated protein